MKPTTPLKTPIYRCLICLNGLALMLIVALYGYSTILVNLKTSMKITELDRAGVINIEKLKEYNPALAINLRSDLGPWIAYDEHQTIRYVLFIAAGTCLFNGLMMILGKSRESI